MTAFFDYKDGMREIRFPVPCKLKEYYTEKEYEYTGTPLKVEFAPDECKVFLIET